MRGRAEGLRDYFGLLTAAVWKPEAVDSMLPKRMKGLAEKRAARDADMARKVHQINSVMRLRLVKTDGR